MGMGVNTKLWWCVCARIQQVMGLGAAQSPLHRCAAEESGAIFRGLSTSPSPTSSGTLSTTLRLHATAWRGVREDGLKYDWLLSEALYQNFARGFVLIIRLTDWLLLISLSKYFIVMITNLKQHLFMCVCNIKHRKAVMKFTAMHIVCLCSGVPRNFFRGGFNKFSWGQREQGSGGGSPLVRGSGGSCNLVQEILFHIVKFSQFLILHTIYDDNQFICHC